MSENRLDLLFDALRKNNRKAIITYFVAGFPDPTTSLQILRSMCQAGADVVELGIPCSDPFCDGPVIKTASDHALGSGMSVERTLALTSALRQEVETPIVLFSYYAPLAQFGVANFIVQAKAAGADGLLLVDPPPAEEASIALMLQEQALHGIPLVTPMTTAERIPLLAKRGGGFLYMTSRSGVTGIGELDTQAIAERVAEVRTLTTLPVCIGFGISNGSDVSKVAPLADGVIVGSAIIKALDNIKDPDKMPGAAVAKLRELCTGLNS